MERFIHFPWVSIDVVQLHITGEAQEEGMISTVAVFSQ
jgi:hypothetical protein